MAIKAVSVHEDTESTTETEAYLSALQSDGGTVKKVALPWMTTLCLNSRNLEFKIDIGADITVIAESDYQERRDGPLMPPERVLTGTGQQPLKVLGQFKGRLKKADIEHEVKIYVVRGLRKPLLGRPAIEALKVVSRVEPVRAGSIFERYHTVFQGLGRLEDNYTIKLRI